MGHRWWSFFGSVVGDESIYDLVDCLVCVRGTETLFIVCQCRDCNLKSIGISRLHGSRLTVNMNNGIQAHDINLNKKFVLKGTPGIP